MRRALYSAALLAFVSVFALTAGQASAVVPQSVRCTLLDSSGRPTTILNTAGCRGYITNTMYWSSSQGINGGPIIYSPTQYAIPFTVNSIPTLESFISGLLGMGSPTDYSYNYNKSGAAFIVATMLGHIGGGIGDFGNVTNMITYAKQNFNNWKTLVEGYGGATAGYYVDWGSPTRSVTIGYPTVNTLHACPAGMASNVCQPTTGAAPSGGADTKDFAWYTLAPGETEITHPITFYSPPTAANPSGESYLMRRECGNPLGGPAFPTPPPPAPASNYDLTPRITPQITRGGSAVAGSVAEVGDVITFTYAVDNTKSGASGSTACTVDGQWHGGYYAVPGTPDSSPTLVPQPATGCPRTFPGSSTTTLVTEPPITVTAADGNKTICRSLFVNPASPTTGALGTETCIAVAAEPYFQVFGGDISVGNGLANSSGDCSTTTNSNGGIAAWNQGVSGAYAGSGTQYAALALAALNAFPTAQNSRSAGPPSSLAFANTTASGGVYGGSMSSLPCMIDYYDTNGAGALISTNVGSLASGPYKSTTSVNNLSGSINTGTRVQIFVNGDVYINSNITYAGKWQTTTVPMFELVVKGNIYIGTGVTQLDGIYIAESNGAAGSGTIYTCATGLGAPVDPHSAAFDTTGAGGCGKQLVFNGSVTAYQVQLLRTNGSLGAASSNDPYTTNKTAETFNYSPIGWIPRPDTVTGGGGSGSSSGLYDAIYSLSPIL